MKACLQAILMQAVEPVWARWPQPRPRRHRLRAARIISHRGQHDNRTVFENTLPAFDAARRGGVWGIELDLRWTADLQPVVIHDADTVRVFGRRVHVNRQPLDALRAQAPLMPTLGEVVQRYGRQLHLMIEIKAEPYPEPRTQQQRLLDELGGLRPVRDFHLLSLAPDMLAVFDRLPPRAMVPIAETNWRRLSTLALAKGYGGVAGHYLLIGNARLRRHQRRGQQVGTGFVNAPNCLWRELNRGVDWLFSDRAVAMQAAVARCLQSRG
jgi:glycerophosphoryl diester phosphodiesterase